MDSRCEGKAWLKVQGLGPCRVGVRGVQIQPPEPLA